jgi:DNA damage-binding protein 1
VGTHPITFNYFENAGAACVFVACDRPTVIHSKNGKLLFSVLDANQVEFTNMTPFHSELFPGCIALSSEAALVIGVIEDVQKVHVQKVPLNQAPRRITHSSQNAVYAGEFIFVWLMLFIYSIFYLSFCLFASVVAEKTARVSAAAGGGEETSNRVLFMEDGSLEQIGLFELDRLEQGLSCTTCVFYTDSNASAGVSSSSSNAPTSSDSGVVGDAQHQSSSSALAAMCREYIAVGTAHTVAGELEPSRGRILVYEIVANRRVHLIAEKEVKGAVFSLATVCGRLVAGVGSKVSFSLFNVMCWFIFNNLPSPLFCCSALRWLCTISRPPRTTCQTVRASRTWCRSACTPAR